MTNESDFATRIPEFARHGFAGLTRPELFQCAKILGVTVAPASKEDTIRRALQTAVGTESGTISDAKVTQIQAKRKEPNLMPNGRWEGRYRRVMLMKTPEFEKQSNLPLGWEDNVKYYAFDSVVDMMYPHFESLRNMKRDIITMRKQLSPETGESEEVKHVTTQQVIPFQDFGDTPGTENLPIHMIDWYQRRYNAEGQFKGFERRRLVAMLARIMGGEVPPSLIKDLTDEDVRQLFLRKINIHEEYEEYADA